MSDDIIVRVNGDGSDVFDYLKQAEAAAASALASEKDTVSLKSQSVAAKSQAEVYSTQANQSSTSAANSNTSAQEAAQKAIDAANRAAASDPELETSQDGVSLSNNTGHYNFLSPIKATVTATGEFDVNVDLSSYMGGSVYDPRSIKKDVFDRANQTGDQSISTIAGLQAALDSKIDNQSGPGGGNNPLLMLKSVYDPNGLNKDTFDRSNHTGTQDISTINGLQSGLDSKVDDAQFTGSNIANLYETVPDRNQFTNALLTKLNGISNGADMLKSVYDPTGVNSDAFNAKNQNYENWPENAVVTIVGGKPTYAKVKAIDGKIVVGSNSVEMGMHLMSSAGEDVMWKNLVTGKIYAPPWQEVNRANSKLPTYRIYTDSNMSSSTSTLVESDQLVNPTWTVVSNENRRLFEVKIKSARDTKQARVIVKSGADVVWNGILGDLKLNQEFNFNLDADSVPFDYYKNTNLTFSMSSDFGDVVLFGDSSVPIPKITYYYRVFDEIPIPDMDSSIYDKNKDGVVDEAEKIKGVDQATNGQYYGKDQSGSVGFFDIPSGGSGAGNGDMLKSVYDTNNNGKVDLSEISDKTMSISGGTSAPIDTYYGKSSSGALGFHSLSKSPSIPEMPSRVYIREFTVGMNIGASSLDSNRFPIYVYKGDQPATVNLPKIVNLSEDELQFGIVNHGKATLKLSVRSQDAWNADKVIKMINLEPGTGYYIASDKNELTWYTIASLNESDIKELQNKVSTLETAVNGHGASIASNAKKVSDLNYELTVLSPQIKDAIDKAEEAKRNAINKVNAEVNDQAKTITLKLMSGTNLISLETVDISGMFSNTPAPTKHPIYYGFSLSNTLNESDIKSGSTESISHVNGHDVTITRVSTTPNYMWIFIPDSLGDPSGFIFGGFKSTWQSAAVSVDGNQGKVFVSPNKTSAIKANFEVTL